MDSFVGPGWQSSTPHAAGSGFDREHLTTGVSVPWQSNTTSERELRAGRRPQGTHDQPQGTQAVEGLSPLSERHDPTSIVPTIPPS